MECSIDKKLQGFQLIAQEKLQAIICSIPGKKDLILEPAIIKPLEHICAASWLKLKGIQHIYKFDKDIVIARVPDQLQVFLLQSKLENFRRVLQHINEQERLQPTDLDAAIKNFHIICVPSCFAYLQSLLEEEGLYGLVQLHRFNWDFIYLDQGVLSMEVPYLFSTLFLRADTSLLPAVAQSLRILQMVCGRPELILSYGEHASNIIKIMETLGDWPLQPVQTTTDFSALLIIDRDKDYASSLLTPAIYAGLLLEVFEQRAGEIEIGSESNKILQQKAQIFVHNTKAHSNSNKPTTKSAKTNSASSSSSSSNIKLNALNDEIYGENRYKHFTQASTLVRAQAKDIGLEVKKLNDMKLDEMHDYVARKLPKVTELKSKLLRHLNASEKVIEMLGTNFRKIQTLEEEILNNVSRKRILLQIDELLITDGQQYNTLRLLCLLHLCVGVSTEELSHFVRNYCNLFGLDKLHAFQQLAQANLLPHIGEEEKLNKSAKQLLSNLQNLPIPKFQQTEFQANANRLKLLMTAAGAEAISNSSNSNNNANKVDAATTNAICPSYVFNGTYIPLVAQLCSLLLKSCSTEDFLSKLGAFDKMLLHLHQGNSKWNAQSIKSYANLVKQAELKDILPLQRKNIFVFVVGGLTYAEIGACDLVARLMGAQIVMASDYIVAGADLIKAAF